MRNLHPCFVKFTKRFSLFILIFLVSFAVNAQKQITGKITGENGVPLNGVTVVVKGTTRGTTTNSTGDFSISASPGETIEFSAVGYKLSSVTVGDQNTISLQLGSEVTNIEEVVVVGYGTQRRALVTGAVASVSGKTISELPVPSVEQALQGRVPGLTVTNNGTPGSAAIVRIRGISSITQNSDPLYVIDGFPAGGLVHFDSRDIESVEILKDASAAAIYGSRASNGVVIITTKKGRRDGKMQVSLDSYVGIQNRSKTLDLLNTSQFLQYERALNGAAGIALPARLDPANFNQPIYAGTTQTYAQTNTDWQDEFFQKGLITQHNIGLSGGGEKSRFYSSIGYFKQEGITRGVDYERFNIRFNSDHQVSKVFSFGHNLYLAYGDQNRDFNDNEGNRTKLMNVIRMPSYLPVYDPTTQGGFRGPVNSFDGLDPINPVEAALIGKHTIKTLKLLGTAFVEINFTSWLKARSTFGVDYTNAAQDDYTPIFNDGGTSSATSAQIRNRRNINTGLLFTQQFTFDKTFDKHHVNAIAVYEQQEATIKTLDAQGNQNTNEIKTLQGATITGYTGNTGENFIMSFIGRVNYDFDGKYIASVSVRRDGLSVWAPGNKWNTFPAASVGWRIDQESFMENVPSISELKLRAGYGLVGLNGIFLGNYPWSVNLQQNAYYPFGGTVNAGANSAYINQLANPALEWENTKQLNIGLDMGLFNNKLTISAEWYKRRSENLILSVPTPPSFGYNGTGVQANVGDMENKGIEFQVGYRANTGEFKHTVTANLATIRNKVLALNTPNASIDAGGDPDFGGSTPITRTIAGQPVQSFYGWIVEGIFDSDAAAQAAPAQVLPGPGGVYDPTKHTAGGDLQFRDVNKDGMINDADRVYLGSYIPKLTYALNYSVSYKNFDLSLFFQGTQGNKIFNGTRIIMEGMPRLFNSGTEVLKAWTIDNKNTDIPRAISGDPNRNTRPSDRWVEDGSYLRLKNMMIGFNLPENSLLRLTKGAVSRFRVYASATNLFTVTKYKGLDPEVGARNLGAANGNLTNGIDYGAFPPPRSFQVGIQATF